MDRREEQFTWPAKVEIIQLKLADEGEREDKAE